MSAEMIKPKLINKCMFVDLEGLVLTENEVKRIQHPMVAGIILFSRNFKNSEQLKQLISDVKRHTNEEFIVAVDQEGGRVQRFREDRFTHLPAMLRISQQVLVEQNLTLEQVRDIGWLMAVECIAHGINLSFAPVLDIENGADVIGDRAFGKTASEVCQVASAFMAGMREAGLPTVGKHFPGHGSTKLDSHIHTPVDDRTKAEIEATDLAPFKKAIDNHELDSIMPAHIKFTKVDSSPVGYSSIWLQAELRERLNFNGIVFSDDLSMAGAGLSKQTPLRYGQRVTKAVSAGCDYVLICNQPDQVDKLLLHNDKLVQQLHIVDSVVDERKLAFLAKLKTQNIGRADDLMHTSRYHQTKMLITKIKSQ